MTVPNIDPITPVSSTFPSPSHFLKVGVLHIEGREYTVSVESSDPLIKSPHSDTLDRIRDLVDLHLNHLKEDGLDLSTIVVQQLDEKGLSYVNEDLEQMNLPSSEINFIPYASSLNPFKEASYPKSLRNPFFSNVTDPYRFLLDSLTKKSESENEEECTTPINTNPFNNDTNFETRIEQTEPKQVIERADESSELDEEDEISDSEDENLGLLSGRSNDLSQYDLSGRINSIKFHVSNLFSKMRNLMPTLQHETDAINPEEVIAEKESTFRSGLSSTEQATLEKFSTIRFD